MEPRQDKRPTLASWPKRIYEWEELPAPFRAALEPWKQQGLPAENVTYIPRVNQYAKSPEFAVAWREGEVMVQMFLNGRIEVCCAAAGSVAQLRYQISLLRCDVTVFLRNGASFAFCYNKTREDLIMPVLNLLLGNPSDFQPPLAHPVEEQWEHLKSHSYAMYHTALLAYRFGETIQSSLFFRGRERSFLYFFRKMPDPEYFLGVTRRGLVAISTDFYGTRAAYLPRDMIHAAPPKEGAAVLELGMSWGPVLAFPLLPGQAEMAAGFLVNAGLAKGEESWGILPDS